MTKRKTKDELLAEKKECEKKAEQYAHQVERLLNRKRYLLKADARKRTHILCNIGGAVLSFWSDVKYLSKIEQYEIFERLSQIPEVNDVFQTAIQRHNNETGGD